jgi:hypothetical protein
MPFFRFILFLFLLIVTCPSLRAQNESNGNNRNATLRTNTLPDTRVMTIEAATVGGLTDLVARNDIDAVSLGVSRAQLDRQAGARQALLQWVASGGTVFLHTDAAQHFGYRTSAARLPSARQAGQLFGRARAALPFGGHRLLWGNASRPVPAPRSLSVRTIYYQMEPGDHLVVEHPAGVGLLAVTDLAAPASNQPLYAAAVAPFGRGWAVFTPRFVESHRADGNAFLGNLSRFAVETALATRHRTANRFADNDVLAVPARLLDNYGQQVAGGGQAEAGPNIWSRLLFPAADAAVQGDTVVRDVTPPGTLAMPVAEAQLLVTRREIRALSVGLSPDANATAQEAARALLATLRARLALQRNSAEKAVPWLNQAVQLAPAAAETLWLQASLAATQGEDIYQPSQVRAGAYFRAAQGWNEALTANSLSEWLIDQERAASPAGAAVNNRAPDLAGVPRTLINLWRDAANFMGNQARTEPPLAQLYGAPGNAVLVRFFPEDPQLPLLAPATQLLARASTQIGWRAEEEEAILFPSINYFGAYRTASGWLRQGTPLPILSGDVNGSRMFLVTGSAPLGLGTNGGILPQADPLNTGLTPDLLPAARLARLHAYVLLNALAGDGTPVPAWMHYGLSGLVNDGVSGDLNAASRLGQAYTNSLKTGGLFSPEQFARAGMRVNTLSQAEAQGYRVMQFFYNRFGAGRVAETLQRLGAGQSVDEALVATTGLTEAGFFAAWNRAETGR